MPQAARQGDMHTCPQVTGKVPHVGGPITTPCAQNVVIGYQAAATLGDNCYCNGPQDTIAQGSSTVIIGNKPAARLGDSTAHGGVIVAGCSSVLIGG